MDTKVDPDNVLVNQEMLCCPETSLSGTTVAQTSLAPINFILTKFHALLLYSDHVKGISLLNQELIFEDIYNDVSIYWSNNPILFTNSMQLNENEYLILIDIWEIN